MPRHSPYRIELSDQERRVLESLARSYTLPYWQVVRAQMMLLAADGLRNDQIAERLRCRREVVSQWRKRFFEQRLAGLEQTLLAFGRHYEQIAAPFEWKFTRHDLDRLLDRLNTSEPAARHAA
jgi:hypothetical protein